MTCVVFRPGIGNMEDDNTRIIEMFAQPGRRHEYSTSVIPCNSVGEKTQKHKRSLRKQIRHVFEAPFL